MPIIPTTAKASPGLGSLHNFPTLHKFVSGWLRFRSESKKMIPNLNDLEAQKKWRLEADETVLSLIDFRLCSITEWLLGMQSSQLPSHIDENDFKHFVSRSRFPCRFQSCGCQYDTVQERDCHEDSHILSFPCSQCDFSGRAFTSRKDLEKHTQRYHMSPDDFEIPENLHTISRSFQGGPSVASGAFSLSSSRSGRWTERGRKAIQQGFYDVLAAVSSIWSIQVCADRRHAIYRSLQGRSHRCWYPCHAVGPLANGNHTRHDHHRMGRPDRRLWPLPSDEMRQISRPRRCLFFRSLANHIPKCGRHLRRGHFDQMFWCWGQLFDNYWGLDARRGPRFQ